MNVGIVCKALARLSKRYGFAKWGKVHKEEERDECGVNAG